MANFTYRTITFADMKDYIEKNAPNDKEWFKSVAIVNGVYNRAAAVREFQNRYKLPELMTKKKESVTALVANW